MMPIKLWYATDYKTHLQFKIFLSEKMCILELNKNVFIKGSIAQRRSMQVPESEHLG